MTQQTSRRTIVSGLAVGGVALPLLAACGSGSGKAGDGDQGSGSVDKGIKTSQIPVGGGKIFADDQVVVTQPTEGEFKAFSAVCTHQGCVVAKIGGKDIDCTCHGSKFSIADGSVVHGPATKALAALQVTVTGEDLKVT